MDGDMDIDLRDRESKSNSWDGENILHYKKERERENEILANR